MRIFVAGATGAIGRALLPLFVQEGHDVTAMTRTPGKAESLKSLGATAVVCDALDRDAVRTAVTHAKPEVVIHQLTDLPLHYRELRKGTDATNRLRTDGTRNLVQACLACGVRRIVAQSIAFLYAPDGDVLKHETARPWTDAPTPFDRTVAAVLDLERTVTLAPELHGVVLRYGTLYGPNTWYAPDGDLANEVRHRRLPIVGSGSGVISFLHTLDAATATVNAIHADTTGIYNIVDDEPTTYREWLPAYAGMLGAKPPRNVPAALARLAAGRFAVAAMTKQQGASNVKARKDLHWQPQYRRWQDGFAELLHSP